VAVSLKQIWRLLKESFAEWNKDKASRLAASLAYYTVFSLAPLLIIVIAIAGAVFGEAAAREQLVGQMEGLLGSEGAEFVETAIQNANRPGENSGFIASIVSIAILLFGASGVFAQLQDALNTIWEVTPKPGASIWEMVRKRILSFGMVLGIGFLLLVSLVISAVLAALNAYMSGLLPGFDGLWQVVNFAIAFGVTTLLFAMIYKFLPDVKIAWGDVWIGAAFTSLLFSIGRSLIGLYLGQSGFASAYGAAGSVIVILAWVFYSAQILFFGAELTQVYARRYGSKIVPDEHAVAITEDARAEQGIPSPEMVEEADRLDRDHRGNRRMRRSHRHSLFHPNSSRKKRW
jgi:membrane protein